MILPIGVTSPSVSPDNLYFLAGVGHVWQINLSQPTSSVVMEIGGYSYSELRIRLLQIYSHVDMNFIWSPREFLDIVGWISEEPWGFPEIPAKDGTKRFRIKWKTKIRICGPTYVPDPKLNNKLYCRPGNLDQAWDEILFRTKKTGNFYVNLESLTPYMYPNNIWGGIWYKALIM